MRKGLLATIAPWVCPVFILALITLMASWATAAPTKPIELKYGHHNKPLSFAQKYAQVPWVKKVEEATQGRVKITIYPSATLFKPNDAYDACVSGIADMAWGFIGLFHSRFPLTNMVSLPLLGIKDAEMGSLCMWHLYEKLPAVQKEYKDVKLLVLHTHRGGPIGTSAPVHRLEDFKGLKIRTPGGGPLDLMKETGASPMKMSPDSIYLNMEKGVIDGWTIDPEGADGRKLQEVTKYYILPYSYVGCFWIIMNKNKWNSLPSDIQDQIMSVSGKFGVRFHGKAWDKSALEAEEKLIREIEKRGGEAVTLPPKEVAKWHELAKPIWDKEIARWENKGMPAREVFDELQRFIKEYR